MEFFHEKIISKVVLVLIFLKRRVTRAKSIQTKKIPGRFFILKQEMMKFVIASIFYLFNIDFIVPYDRAFLWFWLAGRETQGERLTKTRKSQRESVSRQK